ncbi:MAG: mucoidy inhibitor MuiA family protein [Desulfonatronovibrio sp. MSAO_Bac4]|nr:MAG: mucoidy inhibitor MuiA family protein [Desulfonatronovibrio sp. MSAO_Bac4]
MKSISFSIKIYVTFFCLILTFALFPVPGQATPHKVTLFPDSARVYEKARLPVAELGLRHYVEINLPFSADPQTININLPEQFPASITDIAWKKSDALQQPKIEELQKKISELEQQKSEIVITIKSHKIMAKFWESQAGFQAITADTMESLASSIGSNLKDIYTEIETAKEKAEDLNSQISKLREEIEQIAGPENNVWNVSIFLDEPGNARELELEYNYILKNCGWNSFYRLHAEPEQERIHFTWEAEVWQSSGMDWANVQMSLATMEPRRQLIPHPIPDWEVKPRRSTARASRTMDAALFSEMADSADINLKSAPVMERSSTYSQWHIGEKTLIAGQRPRFKIQEKIWPADFTRLVRPSTGGNAFIRADVEFDEAVDLPQGKAILLLDNASVGNINLRMTGNQETLFFGVDPFLKAELITREKKSGVRGIISNRQTYLWDFLISIENQHTYPVAIRVEEPRPIIRDERIKSSLKLRPEPDETTENLLIWNFDLPAQDKTDIEININMEAPEDMDIDWGWRR